MNGTNTLVPPGAGDAALLRVKGTRRALALSLDGPGRIAALDPRVAAVSAVLEGALNVAVSGATPIGVTNCLNFASPETPEGYWQLREAVAGLSEACRALGLPIVSGNVSLYNETPDGPILPAPLIGMVGLLDDRSLALPMRWTEGDEIWFLGAPAFDADALAGSELAWRRETFGGRPRVDLDEARRVIELLPRLAAGRLVRGAHDVSLGGVGVALARLAMASGSGARVSQPLGMAALFGERSGRRAAQRGAVTGRGAEVGGCGRAAAAPGHRGWRGAADRPAERRAAGWPRGPAAIPRDAVVGAASTGGCRVRRGGSARGDARRVRR